MFDAMDRHFRLRACEVKKLSSAQRSELALATGVRALAEHCSGYLRTMKNRISGTAWAVTCKNSAVGLPHACQAQCSNPVIRLMDIVREELHYVQARVRMFLQVTQKIRAFDEEQL